MPKRRENRCSMAAASGEDRISALPDELLHLVLNSLPSDDAVRTCVLSRRWTHLWKSASALRIQPRGRGTTWGPWTAVKLRLFVQHLLLLRGRAPLDEFAITCGELDGDSGDGMKYDEMSRTAGLWIRHALTIGQARVLRVSFRGARRLCLDRTPFDSELLTKVELTDVTFYVDSVDFSRCLALTHLKMSGCKIYGASVSSQSLTYLSISECYFDGANRTRIATPRLVLLELSLCNGMAPFIEKMPLLVAANVRLQGLCEDKCRHHLYNIDADGWFRTYCGKPGCLENLSSCDSCYGTDDGSSVLLEGLSATTTLEITCDAPVFICRKDCRQGTIFSKLKTLYLNEWCLVDNFGALVYFLRCSPILEKLTLRLSNCETRDHVVKRDDNYRPNELKVVEIHCPKLNVLVEKIITILMDYGIQREQINIKQNFSPPDLSGYETWSEDEDSYYHY